MQILDRTLMVSDSVVYAELDDEAVLLNVDTGIYFGLNGIATDIWRSLEQGASLNEIVELLLNEYEVEPAQLHADVSDFLTALAARGLLRAAEC